MKRVSFKDVLDQKEQGYRFIPLISELVGVEFKPISFFSQLSRTHSESFYFSHTQIDKSFAVMGLKPFLNFKVIGGKCRAVKEGEELQLQTQEPIAALDALMSNYNMKVISGIHGFAGGAFGYFGYDFVRHLEPRLKKAGYFRDLEKNAQTIDAEISFFDEIVLFDLSQSRVFAVKALRDFQGLDFEAFKTYFENCEQQLEMLIDSVKAQVGSGERTAGKMSRVESVYRSLGEENYFAGVKALKEEIKQGEIFQAVLADRFTARGTFDSHEIFAELCESNKAPYKFHIRSGATSRLGASPEMLLHVSNNGRLETHPIAGTRPRGKSLVEDSKKESQLLKSTKERAEHLMLVDLARNDLGHVSKAGSVAVDKYREVHKFDTVMHLVSQVTGQLSEEKTALQAFASCFPAGTLSGAPKIRAMEILSELETEPRGFYGGAVVALGFDGSLDSCIAIRAVEVTPTTAVFQAGAGVVADSRAEREHNEVLQKTLGLRKILGLALAGELE